MAELPGIIYKIDERSYYDKFARTLVKHLSANIDKISVTNPHGQFKQVKSSFKYRLFFDSNRRINRIQFEHDFKGLFIDLGVGTGTKLQDIGHQKIGRSLIGRKVNGRRARRWYLKTIYGQTIRLMNIVAQTRGDEFTVLVSNTLEEFKKIKITI